VIKELEKGLCTMRCLILSNNEIADEECQCVIKESYKVKNGKELPKKVKRIVGWKSICKSCSNHKLSK
jgi:hypothetical protein